MTNILIGGERLHTVASHILTIDQGKLAEQLQPSSIDLTLDEIFVPHPHFSTDNLSNNEFIDALRGAGHEVGFDRDGTVHLGPGGYLVTFAERKASFDGSLTVFPRSTLFRLGNRTDVVTYAGRDPNSLLFTGLQVLNPHGVNIEKGARIMQAILSQQSEGVLRGVGEHMPLPIEEVRRFRRAGFLGKDTKDLDVYEDVPVADGKFIINNTEPHMIVLGGVEIPVEEVWLASQNGNVIPSMLTQPIPLISGGVGDPGFKGNWQVLMTASQPGLELVRGSELTSLVLKRFPLMSGKQVGYRGSYQQG